MTRTACLVCLVSTVSACHKNTLGRVSASNRYIIKLEQSTFLDIYDINKMKSFIRMITLHCNSVTAL